MKIIEKMFKCVSIPNPHAEIPATIEFVIPEGYKWVAVDGNGEVWAYMEKPRASDCYYWFDGDSHCEEIGSVGGKCQSWRDMLIEVK